MQWCPCPILNMYLEFVQDFPPADDEAALAESDGRGETDLSRFTQRQEERSRGYGTLNARRSLSVIAVRSDDVTDGDPKDAPYDALGIPHHEEGSRPHLLRDLRNRCIGIRKYADDGSKVT